MENGVRLPYQISSAAIQNVREDVKVTVSAYIDKRIGGEQDKRIEVDLDKRAVFFMGKKLTGVKSFSIFDKGEQSMVCVEFTVDAVYGDTIEKPININA